MRYRLEGNWKKGLAFDLHTLASTYLGTDEFGHDRWDTTRSEMGELVYQLKYQNDKSVVPKIVELLKPIGKIEQFDAIIPVPSSKDRPYQPVDEIAKALGEQRSVPVLQGYLKKETGIELKGIDDPDERKEALMNSISIQGDTDISGNRVLLIDDLYRSGATLKACCHILTEQSKVEFVSVLTMTKSRSKK
uniref:ComF family protein n=1 Tax=Pararhizobium sp. IMCC3301 TaxID=3067904 RepID=UPI0027424FC8|nr:ComF family protein [Pararhizobium sp. IMCC3301]